MWQTSTHSDISRHNRQCQKMALRINCVRDIRHITFFPVRIFVNATKWPTDNDFLFPCSTLWRTDIVLASLLMSGCSTLWRTDSVLASLLMSGCSTLWRTDSVLASLLMSGCSTLLRTDSVLASLLMSGCSTLWRTDCVLASLLMSGLGERSRYKLFAMGWTVLCSNPGGGVIFITRPDRSWCPPSFLYNGYRVSLSGVKRPDRSVNQPP